MKYLRAVILHILSTILIVSYSTAQDELPIRGPAAERVRQFKKLRLMESVKMDDETAIRFMSRYNRQEEDMRNIMNGRNALIDQLQGSIKSNEKEENIEDIIHEITLSEEKAIEIRLKFLEDLKTILSQKQIAEFIVFERNFNKNLREIMRDIAKGRWDRRKER